MRKLQLTVVAVVLLLALEVFAQAQTTFTELQTTLPGLMFSSVAIGDADNDGDLDLLLCGSANAQYPAETVYCKIYKNNGSGVFSGPSSSFPGVEDGAVAWGDYNNDGSLDVAMSGQVFNIGRITRVYRKDIGDTYTKVAALEGTNGGSLAWGDCDNDGDIDLAACGSTFDRVVTTLYRNDQRCFTGSSAGLPNVGDDGCVAFGDYDRDGDLDAAVTGRTGPSGTDSLTKVYRNDNGTYVDIGASLTPSIDGLASWADYDNDGSLDLLITGSVTQLYHNDNGQFSPVTSFDYPAIYYSAVAWGDVDNDGDLDLAMTGEVGLHPVSALYINQGDGTFARSEAVLPALRYGGLAWGDIDADGDLDLIMTGQDSSGQTGQTKVLRNDTTRANTPPSAPTGLAAVVNGVDVQFNWSAASDAETPSGGLTYNIRVGTAPGKGDIISGMSDLTTGYRRVPEMGNVQSVLSWKLKGLKSGTYYWSVQAVDSAYAGSQWAPEQTVVVGGWKISGYIKTTAGAAVPGVLVAADNGGGSSVTNSNGWYELGVPSGWSGTISPSKDGYWFNPQSLPFSSITADQANANFTAYTSFSRSSMSIPALPESNISWADIDNDGDLDLALTGDTTTDRVVKILKNNGTSFSEFYSFTTSNNCGFGAWGDYDDDGDPDLGFIDGYYAPSILRNDTSTFSKLTITPDWICEAAVDWGDYNNDGKADLVASGMGLQGNYYTVICKNPGTTPFTRVTPSVAGARGGCIEWADYDNDGDLDLAECGISGQGGLPATGIYRNDNGVYTNIGAGLPDLIEGRLAWGDYDSDGDLDLILTGTGICRLYRNDNGSFTALDPGIPGAESGGVAWGDYDNDGDLDIAIAGSGYCRIYRNDNGVFTDTKADLPQIWKGAIAWGDYDGDGKLDLAITGNSPDGPVSGIYHNEMSKANTVPQAPGKLTTFISGNTATFNWDPSTDAETPAAGLSYNIRVANVTGGCNFFSGLSGSTGKRRVVDIGNAQKRLSWTLNNLATNKFFWSVQAIDSAYAGSPWATQRMVGSVFIRQGLAKVKGIADGTVAGFGPVVVTAVFSDCFYVEAPDRSMGIQVRMAGNPPAVGKQLNIEGVVGTDPLTGERYVDATTVVDIGSGSITPVGLANRLIGGGILGLQDTVWSWIKAKDGTQTLCSAAGLNNIGLMVRAFGKVTQIDPAGKYFYMDDGSNLQDGSLTGSALNTGIRVAGDGRAYAAGSYKVIKGISSCFKGADGKLRRLLKPLEIR